MGWISGIAMYLVIWWTVLFAVLPWGIKRNKKTYFIEGEEVDAPENPQLLKKFIITSCVAFVFWLIAHYLISIKIIDFRPGAS